MGAYKTKSRSYRRRTQKRKTNKRLTKRRRKSFRKIRKQEGGNPKLIAAAVAAAALGAGVYYKIRDIKNKREKMKKREIVKKSYAALEYDDDSSVFSDSE
tara:strand:+ start:200 stop:499 length:300 start_codon:yes stop_codon:yes gene_type:complete